MKQELLYTRKGKTIHDIVANTSETFASKNKAKQASVKLQRKNGGLGCGSLQVDKRKGNQR